MYALRAFFMAGLIGAQVTCARFRFSLETRNFSKVKITASFPGLKWIAPDIGHLRPWSSPGLGLKWRPHLRPKLGLLQGLKWEKLLSWHNSVTRTWVWNSIEIHLYFAPWFPRLDLSWPVVLLWLLRSLAAPRGWLSDHFQRPLLLATRNDVAMAVTNLESTRKAKPSPYLVLRRNYALRIGRKDFVEPVFMISLNIVFCNAALMAGESLRRL